MPIAIRRLGVTLGTMALTALATTLIVVGIFGVERWLGRQPEAELPRPAPDLRPRTDRQIASLQSRLRQRPGEVHALAQLGHLYLQKARESGDPAYYPRAEATFHQAREHDPDDVAALVGLGSVALSRHRFREALAWGEQVRALAPRTAAVHGLIGDAQMELGLYEEAVDSYQQMVDVRPDLNSYARVSYLRELHGDLPGAVQAMEMAVQAGAPGQESTAWTRVQLGHLHFNTGTLDAAETEYRAALREVPDYPHALAALGRVEAARGSYPAAIDLYKRATANVPLAEYVIALGEMYQAAGQPEQARQQFELVAAMQQLHAANGVATDLEMAVFDLDHDRDAAGALGRLRALATEQSSVKTLDALAWALYRNGDCRAAREAMGSAMRLGTQDALLFFHAGLIAECLGRTGEARAQLERALELNPHFSVLHAPVARETLARLRHAA